MKKILILIALAAVCSTQAQGAWPWRKKTPKKTEEKKEEKKTSAYEKIFKDKQHKRADGLVTLHKVDGDIYLEVPLKRIGERMLLGTTVAAISDGGESSQGIHPTAPRQVVFGRTDSLVQLSVLGDNYIVPAADTTILRALELGRRPAVLFSMPIEAWSPDSSAVVCKATSLFLSQSDMLSPKDPGGYISMGGYVTRDYSYKEKLSYIKDVAAFPDNVSVLSELSYEVSRYFLGIIRIGEAAPLTATMRITLMALGEPARELREADARVGTSRTRILQYSSADQGILVRWLADRWNFVPSDSANYKAGRAVSPVKGVVFQLDPDFPESWKEPIRRGVLLWNEAFIKAGWKDAIQVVEAAADSLRDFDDITLSTIRYAPSHGNSIRSNVWTDPRTGQILSANIYISHDIIKQIADERLLQTGAADPRARAIEPAAELFSESLTGKVARQVGLCLGLSENLAGSYAYPADSLRSAAFTASRGLSASIMDRVPLNFFARQGDVEKGVALCQTVLGPYDFYAVDWLYGTKDKAEDKVRKVAGDPVYRYGMVQNVAFDPRNSADDLGGDAIRSAAAGLESLRAVVENVSWWLDDQDRDYTYREEFYEKVYSQYYSYIMPVMGAIGGVYLNERYAGDPDPAWQAVDKASQRQALQWVMDNLRDMQWLNQKGLVCGDGLNADPAADFRGSVFGSLMDQVSALSSRAALSDDPYRMNEALDDISAALWNRRAGYDPSMRSVEIKYVEKLIGLAGMTDRSSQGSSRSFALANAARETMGMTPTTTVAYPATAEQRHLVYGSLVGCREKIASARSAAPSSASGHYSLLLFKIDKALEDAGSNK